jgi:hypothetical protein
MRITLGFKFYNPVVGTMSCGIRLKAKGSGYVKESCGNSNELSSKLNEMMMRRDQDINQIFSTGTAPYQLDSDGPIPKAMDLAVYSLALDKYVTEKMQRTLMYITPAEPDYENMYEVVATFLYAVKAENIKGYKPPRRQATHLEVAQFTTPRWGACMLHVFINL